MISYLKGLICKDKLPKKEQYSVSLVYAKHQQKSSTNIEYVTSLRVFITYAYSKDEALGKAINEFSESAIKDDFRLTNSVVLLVN